MSSKKQFYRFENQPLLSIFTRDVIQTLTAFLGCRRHFLIQKGWIKAIETFEDHSISVDSRIVFNLHHLSGIWTIRLISFELVRFSRFFKRCRRKNNFTDLKINLCCRFSQGMCFKRWQHSLGAEDTLWIKKIESKWLNRLKRKW